MTDYNNPTSPGLPARSSVATPVFSTFSLLAIVSALVSLFVVRGTLSFVLAIAAIVLGVLGMLEAVLPTRRGGIVSFIAVAAGLLGVVIALFRLLGTAAHHA